MPKFTDMLLKSLKPREKKYQIRETTGFALRVSPKGLKSFLFVYESGGNRKELNLGNYPSIGIADARIKYNNAHDLWGTGVDPKIALLPISTDLLPEPEVVLTVDELLGQYIQYSSSLHGAKYVATKKGAFENHLSPLIGNLPITDVKRKHLLQALNKLQEQKVKRGGIRNAYKAASAMFNYALIHELIESSPCFSLPKAIPSLNTEARTRTLSVDEIKKLWGMIDSVGARAVTKNSLKLILVTAQRPGEVCGMEWEEIEMGDEWWWTIPPEKNMKGKRHHRVYLTSLAKELMGAPGTGCVFPSPKTNDSPSLDPNTLQQLARRLKLSSRWTPHDLRRTARTGLARLKVPERQAEAVINHAKQGMVKIYDQYEYDDEKRDALLKWEAEVKRIVG